MLHLFRKIYLEQDINIDLDKDRIVVSEQCGVPNWNVLDTIGLGQLIFYGKNLYNLNTPVSFLELLNILNERTKENNKTIYIYADKNNYYKILSLWYKIILPNATVNDVISFVKLFFDYKNFWKISRFYNFKKIWSTSPDWLFDRNKLETEYNSLIINSDDYETFINENVGKFNIELLLASYLYNGSRKEELKAIMIPLLREELSKSLYGIREHFTYCLLNKKFLEKLGIVHTIDINNILYILEYDNPIIKTFYQNNSVWKLNFLSHAAYDIMNNWGSDSMISFENITDEDIFNIKQFLINIGISETDSAGMEWRYLLDLIPLVKSNTITDEQLDQLINHQESQESLVTTGTFYSISFPTVNTYFVQHIFNQFNEDNTEILAPYVI